MRPAVPTPPGLLKRHAPLQAAAPPLPAWPAHLGKGVGIQLGCLQDAVVVAQLGAVVGQLHLLDSLREAVHRKGKSNRRESAGVSLTRKLNSKGRPPPQVLLHLHTKGETVSRGSLPPMAPRLAYPHVFRRRLRADVGVPLGGERPQAGQGVQRGPAHPATLAALQLVQFAAGRVPRLGL